MYIICCKVIKVPDIRIQAELWRRILRSFDQLLYDRHMAVIYMSVGYDMYQFSGHQPADLCQHVHQHRILYHIPVVGCQYILRPLVKDGVELFSRHIESHAVGAWLQVHLGKIPEVIYIGQYAPGVRCIL